MNTTKNAQVKMVLKSTFEVRDMRGALVEVVSGPDRGGAIKVRPIGRKWSAYTLKNCKSLLDADGCFEVYENEIERFV